VLEEASMLKKKGKRSDSGKNLNINVMVYHTVSMMKNSAVVEQILLIIFKKRNPTKLLKIDSL